MSELVTGCMNSLEALRRVRPRVHCITNFAAISVSANALLALGAHPSTTVDPKEVAAFTESADALAVNLGTLDSDRRESIPRAIAAAETANKPWVLDPVMATRSPMRQQFAEELLKKKPTVIRGNATEIQDLKIGMTEFSIVAATGAVDIIQDRYRDCRIENGSPLMDRVTAMGCAETAVVAAFCAVEKDWFLATVQAIFAFNVAGEIAAEKAAGPGTFQPHLLDALAGLKEPDLLERAKVTFQ